MVFATDLLIIILNSLIFTQEIPASGADIGEQQKNRAFRGKL
jgi:hypothetical protein